MREALDIAEEWFHKDAPTARETFVAMYALRKEVIRLRALLEASGLPRDAREDGA